MKNAILRRGRALYVLLVFVALGSVGYYYAEIREPEPYIEVALTQANKDLASQMILYPRVRGLL
jgi:hypothetical protein